LDGVIVATPNISHASIVMDVLQSGAAVLCEKPLGCLPKEVESMCEAARRADLPLTAGYPSSLRPEVAKLRDRCRRGDLGQIQSVKVEWLRSKGTPSGWFVDRSLSGGGVLLDLGSHVLHAVMTCLTTDSIAKSVCIQRGRGASGGGPAGWYGGADITGCDVEVAAEGFVAFANGIGLTINVAWDCATPRDRTVIEIRGTAGEGRIDTLFGFSPHGDRPQYPLSIYRSDADGVLAYRAPADPSQPHRALLAKFLASIGTGFQYDMHLRAALDTAEITAALYAAAEKRA
ncbi:MAG TPA: Gfo/Idh/MocA family oxidoreductase, partial [Sphingomonas sp.]